MSVCSQERLRESGRQKGVRQRERDVESAEKKYRTSEKSEGKKDEVKENKKRKVDGARRQEVGPFYTRFPIELSLL